MYPIVEQWLTCKGEVDKVAFCKDHNVSYHSLGYWQTKYIKEHSTSKHQSTSDFLPVKVLAESPSNSDCQSNLRAEIEFPSGLILKIY